MSYNRFRVAALASARRGWPVFPLRSNSKLPAIKQWEQQATTDESQINRWWSDNSRKNVGIACRPSGLHVLDLDDAHGLPPPPDWPGARHGRDILTRLAGAAGQAYPGHTFTVRTPNNGLHLYFRAPAEPELRNTIGRLGWRIDTRGAGGYIVAAGSVTTTGIYRPCNHTPIAALPAWLIPLLLPPDPPKPLRSRNRRPHHPDAYLDAVVTGEADNVRTAPPGQRHHTLLRAAGRLGRLVGGGDLDEHQVRAVLHAAAAGHDGVDGWSVREAEKTITDGLAWGRTRPRSLTDHR